jgi:hypothetical protein
MRDFVQLSSSKGQGVARNKFDFSSWKYKMYQESAVDTEFAKRKWMTCVAFVYYQTSKQGKTIEEAEVMRAHAKNDPDTKQNNKGGCNQLLIEKAPPIAIVVRPAALVEAPDKKEPHIKKEEAHQARSETQEEIIVRLREEVADLKRKLDEQQHDGENTRIPKPKASVLSPHASQGSHSINKANRPGAERGRLLICPTRLQNFRHRLNKIHKSW